MLSTLIVGQSHWFNRTRLCGFEWDVDLTGDQFGHPAIQLAGRGLLYAAGRERPWSDLSAETLSRASVLAIRAGLLGAARCLK